MIAKHDIILLAVSKHAVVVKFILKISLAVSSKFKISE